VPTLRELRLGRFWTQRDLAREAGVQRNTIARIEAGLRKRPYPSTMGRICQAMGVKAQEVEEFRSAFEPRHKRSKKAAAQAQT